MILAEFFQGITETATLRSLEAYFRAMPCLTPVEPDTYLAAAALYRGLRRKGVTIRSTIDCLIARLAEEHGYMVLSKDRDMKFILDSGLCGVRRAPLEKS